MQTVFCPSECYNGHAITNKCQCKDGWMGECCNKDVNECLQNNKLCNPNVCINTVGSYKCSCHAGYEEEDGACTDIDECSGNVCDQICTNTEGSYKCSCREGYLLSDDNRKCIIGNMCKNSNHNCDHICVSKPDGSYSCKCKLGYYEQNNSTKCLDIDECLLSLHNCNQLCINTPGSYKCSCKSGFKTNNNGLNCSDIDECADISIHCDYQCKNTPGSFECLCPSGFKLLSDKRTCQELPVTEKTEKKTSDSKLSTGYMILITGVTILIAISVGIGIVFIKKRIAKRSSIGAIPSLPHSLSEDLGAATSGLNFEFNRKLQIVQNIYHVS
ncbi:DgyrCDS2170 [Dimorphilus gyrociliatus]|uniref:DgyrCDS2170 n=1 Tax=Dimorphilus gyrociliatus TaxID=2664684 RepID=A0A7I8VB98_9ANNE|nr:DgyrCDS2170 [Dimorphilus gyrociliatus]